MLDLDLDDAIILAWAIISLFFRSPRCREARIPADKERSFADNFLQKQQKQRGHAAGKRGFLRTRNDRALIISGRNSRNSEDAFETVR
jgi:hypothetical protein